jgi:SAM-dependent methyltransferase
MIHMDMIQGFPYQLISALRCKQDGAPLQLDQKCQMSEDGAFVRQGTLRCTNCSVSFAIDDGILNMLDADALDQESQHEKQLRNVTASSQQATGPAWYENEQNLSEIIPTLEALSVNQDMTILELGCGDGRYTVQLAGLCKWIVALDFSIESLRILAQRCKKPRNVALVLGDISNIKVCNAHFDRVFSTLASNLPTREHRQAMYHLATQALKSDGRFVFSTHHHGLRQRLSGEDKSGRYTQGGIYRYNFTVSECYAEVRPYFKSVTARPIQIHIPFARTLRLPIVAQSRFLERIPLLSYLGNLILCTAERPLRSEMVNRSSQQKYSNFYLEGGEYGSDGTIQDFSVPESGTAAKNDRKPRGH